MRRLNFLEMQLKIFTIPVIDGRLQEEEMNLFLRSHRIVSVEKHYAEAVSAWTFCITYIENGNSYPVYQTKKEKIDYKAALDEATFAKFSKFREARKQIANEEAIPAYSVFTNEELAEIAALPDYAQGCIIAIKGIGEKRAEKYEGRLIELYHKLAADETGGISD